MVRGPLALCAGFVLSCGSENGPAPPGSTCLFDHVSPVDQDGGPGRTEPRPLGSFFPGTEADLWKGVGVERVFPKEIWGTEDRHDNQAVPALILVGGRSPALTRALNGAEESVGRVELDVSFWGPGRAKVYVAFLDAEGDEIWRSSGTRLGMRRGPETVTIETQEFRAMGRSAAAIAVGVENLQGPLGLVGVRLFDLSPESLLPAHGAPEPRTLGTSTRQAVGLFEGRPLEVRVTVPSEAWLYVSAGAAPSLPRASELLVTIEGDGWAKRVPVPIDGASWRDEHIDLSGRGGEEILVSLRAKGGDDGTEGACLLGDCRLIGAGNQGRPATVVLMSSDTHRGDYLSNTARGFSLFTPSLDRLQSGGVQFLDSMSTTNVTNPSHISLLTGLHPRDTGVVDNTTLVAERAVTLAEVFRKAGYRTFGAVSVAHLSPKVSGLAQGFDRFDAPGIGGRSGGATVDVLKRWIAESPDVPTFVFLHIYEAHAPYRPAEETAARQLREPPPANRPQGAPELPEWAKPYVSADARATGELDWIPERLYRAEIEDLDSLVGDALGLFDPSQSIFAFVSDHGESFGASGTWWNHASLAPGNLTVPLMIRAPGQTPSRVSRPIQTTDLPRTLIDLAGVDAPDFPGRNLLDPGAASLGDEPRFALSAGGDAASVSLGPWHLTLGLRDCPKTPITDALGFGEVLLVDLREAVPRPNRLEDEFPRAKKMRAALIHWLDQASSSKLVGAAATLNASAIAELSALGYATHTTLIEGAWWNPEEANPNWIRRFE